MINRDDLVEYLNRTLEVGSIDDYCPNGLQVAGKADVHHVVTGVTASLALLDQAIAAGADAVLVHHGYFWRGESPVVVGMKHARIKRLMDADVSLLAYHLPLDTHPVFGNNAQLAKLLDWRIDGQCAAGGVADLFFHGQVTGHQNGHEFADHIAATLGRSVTVVGDPEKPIKRIGWCSGGAQRMVLQAAGLGLDAFVSGEISEQTTHEARENGLLYVAAGHHATERYGVCSIGEHLAEQLQLTHQFIDVDNPA